MTDRPKLESRKTVFKGRKIGLAIEEYTRGEATFTVEVVVHPGAVVVVPVLATGEILYLEQFRPAIGEWLIELPAGTLHPGEDPPKAAVRELEEETGYRAGRVEKIGLLYPAPGYSSEILHVYVASDVSEGVPQREPHEVIRVRRATLEELMQLAEMNVLKDAKSIAALVLYKASLKARSR